MADFKDLEGTYRKYVSLDGSYVKYADLNGSVSPDLMILAFSTSVSGQTTFDATGLFKGTAAFSDVSDIQVDPTRVFVSSALLGDTTGLDAEALRRRVAEALVSVGTQQDATVFLINGAQVAPSIASDTTADPTLLASGTTSLDSVSGTSLDAGQIFASDFTVTQPVATTFAARAGVTFDGTVSVSVTSDQVVDSVRIRPAAVSVSDTSALISDADRIAGGTYSDNVATVITGDADLLAAGVFSAAQAVGITPDANLLASGTAAFSQAVATTFDDLRIRLATLAASSASNTTFDATRIVPLALWAHVVYSDQTDDELEYAVYDGSSWSTEVVDTSDTGIRGVSTVVGSDGTIHVAYVYGGDLKYASKPVNGSWSVETVDSGADVLYYIDIKVDSVGDLHVSYHNRVLADGTRSELKYAYYNGTSWSTEVVEGPASTQIGQYSSVAVDSSDLPRIAYSDRTNDRVRYAVYNGTSWSLETVHNTANRPAGISLALDSSDNPHVIFNDGSLNAEYTTKDGTWSTPETLPKGTRDRFAVRGPDSLVLDSSDVPRVAGMTYTIGDTAEVAYLDRTGGSWTRTVVDTNSVDLSALFDLELGNFDLPEISYAVDDGGGTGSFDLKYARYDGSSWSTETITAPGDVGQYNASALAEAPYSVSTSVTTATTAAVQLVLGAVASLPSTSGITPDANLLASGTVSAASTTGQTTDPTAIFAGDFTDAVVTSGTFDDVRVRPGGYTVSVVTAQTSSGDRIAGATYVDSVVTAGTYDPGLVAAADFTVSITSAQTSLPTRVRPGTYTDSVTTSGTFDDIRIRPGTYTDSVVTSGTFDDIRIRPGTGTYSVTSGTSLTAEVIAGGPSYYSDVVVPIGSVVSHWKLDESSGSTAADETGTNDGTINGSPTLGAATDVYGGGTCYENAASGDYVLVSDDASLNVGASQSYTFSTWIKNDTTNSGYVFLKGSNPGYYLDYNESLDRIQAFIRDGSGNLATENYNSSGIWDGNWHHIVMRLDRGTDTLDVFVDGVKGSGTSMSSVGDITSTDDLRIANPYDGKADEVTIFSKALSDAEVTELYRGGATEHAIFAEPATQNLVESFRVGSQWSPHRDIETADVCDNVKAVKDSVGDVHVVYNYSGQEVAYRKFSNGSWSSRTTVEAAPNGIIDTAAIDVDSSDNPRIFVVDGNGPATVYEYNGTSWDSGTEVNATVYGNYCEIKIDSNDNNHLIYGEYSGGAGKQLYYNTNSGGSYSEETIDSPGTDTQIVGADLMLDSSDIPHVVYASTEFVNSSRSDALMYYNNRSGGSWSSEETFLSNFEDNLSYQNVHAAFDSAEDVYGAFEFNGVTDDLYEFDNSSGSFSGGSLTSNRELPFDFIVDSDDTLHTVTRNITGDSMNHWYKESGGSWTSLTVYSAGDTSSGITIVSIHK